MFRRDRGARGAEIVAVAAGIAGAADACVDTRGLAISGTGEGIEVMAREDESPWALEGE